MKCPYCHAEDTKVVDSRGAGEGQMIRRRRECCTCHRRFNTQETVTDAPLWIQKRDNRREPYEREKLRQGLGRACYKSTISPSDIEQIIDSIEARLLGLGRSTFSSEEVGMLALEELQARDQVSYVRFASVYHRFRAASEFALKLRPLLAEASERLPNTETTTSRPRLLWGGASVLDSEG